MLLCLEALFCRPCQEVGPDDSTSVGASSSVAMGALAARTKTRSGYQAFALLADWSLSRLLCKDLQTKSRIKLQLIEAQTP